MNNAPFSPSNTEEAIRCTTVASAAVITPYVLINTLSMGIQVAYALYLMTDDLYYAAIAGGLVSLVEFLSSYFFYKEEIMEQMAGGKPQHHNHADNGKGSYKKQISYHLLSLLFSLLIYGRTSLEAIFCLLGIEQLVTGFMTGEISSVSLTWQKVFICFGVTIINVPILLLSEVYWGLDTVAKKLSINAQPFFAPLFKTLKPRTLHGLIIAGTTFDVLLTTSALASYIPGDYLYLLYSKPSRVFFWLTVAGGASVLTLNIVSGALKWYYYEGAAAYEAAEGTKPYIFKFVDKVQKITLFQAIALPLASLYSMHFAINHFLQNRTIAYITTMVSVLLIVSGTHYSQIKPAMAQIKKLLEQPESEETPLLTKTPQGSFWSSCCNPNQKADGFTPNAAFQ